jgi:hypothetical protein
MVHSPWVIVDVYPYGWINRFKIKLLVLDAHTTKVLAILDSLILYIYIYLLLCIYIYNWIGLVTDSTEITFFFLSIPDRLRGL